VSKRLTLEEVVKYFKDNECVLLENVYINNKTPMGFKCSCGNDNYQITLVSFKRGARCDLCGIKRRADKNRLDFKYVKQYFEDHGCMLLEDTYINNHTLMRYVCSCGNDMCRINFNSFKNGHRCNKCGRKKTTENKKLPYEKVKEFFEYHGCILLDDNYVNSDTPLRYLCSCGNISKISYSNFKNGQRCMKCGTRNRIEKSKIPYEEVKKYFESQGCLLLEEEYINARVPMRYICSCGNESKICFHSFRSGSRCKDCGLKKVSGENSYLWQGGITEISVYFREMTTDWKKNSLINSEFKCAITRLKDNLEIHHLYPFHKILKETFDILDFPVYETISQYTSDEFKLIKETFTLLHDKYGLGVVLNKSVHEEFHNIYGRKDFTPENFEEFKLNKIKLAS
jgi:hypothetical protein